MNTSCDSNALKISRERERERGETYAVITESRTSALIIIIVISIFKEDNVFSITASLPYGPPVNTDIDYYRTFFGLVNFCKRCEIFC